MAPYQIELDNGALIYAQVRCVCVCVCVCVSVCVSVFLSVCLTKPRLPHVVCSKLAA